MNQNTHILFKLASRERPERFLDTLNNLYRNIANENAFTIYCVLDSDDPTIDAYKEILRQTDWLNLADDYGASTGKINAINRPIRGYWGGILVNWSDDMRATMYGFDQYIRMQFEEHFPDGDGLIHLEDCDAKDRVPTLHIVDRKYFDRDGFIYNPVYESLFADNEAMEVAILRGKYKYVSGLVYQHLLPSYGHLPEDAMYRRQQDIGWTRDQVIFNERKARNFDL